MYNELALEIIKEAVSDLKNNTIYKTQSLQIDADKNKASAKKFFKSDWFEFLCDCLNINAKMILEELKIYL